MQSLELRFRDDRINFFLNIIHRREPAIYRLFKHTTNVGLCG